MVLVDTEQHYSDLCRLLNTDHVVKDLGKLEWYLGISFEQNFEKSTVVLSQEKYISNLAIEHNCHNGRAAHTVLPTELPTIQDVAKTPEQIKASSARPYRQLLGAINFVATNTRPDISMAVSYLATFGNGHGLKHWQAMLHLLRYLYSTRNLKLTYCYQESNANVMSIYADSGYASCDPLLERGQYSAYVAMLNGGAVEGTSHCN